MCHHYLSLRRWEDFSPTNWSCRSNWRHPTFHQAWTDSQWGKCASIWDKHGLTGLLRKSCRCRSSKSFARTCPRSTPSRTPLLCSIWSDLWCWSCPDRLRWRWIVDRCLLRKWSPKWEWSTRLCGSDWARRWPWVKTRLDWGASSMWPTNSCPIPIEWPRAPMVKAETKLLLWIFDPWSESWL